MFYSICKVIVKAIFNFLFRIKVHGLENVPETGKCILYSNHISLLDPLMIAVILKRRIYFMAKKELFDNKLIGPIIKRWGAFPVKRGKPDISAIKTALRILKEGKIFGIFPEGTRGKERKIKDLEPGIVMIAVKSKAPVIPVVIKNRYKLFSTVNILIGKPRVISTEGDKRLSPQEIKEIGDQMKGALEQLLSKHLS
ncbi:MAG TPA: 1-acyl-sn-glycerol-3-phosphate acyltransferase [Clostridiales bacterium]|nr:1-acyl-sn-glycerol-3-phosphate acyltransferase [Clostridiales bacterium]